MSRAEREERASRRTLLLAMSVGLLSTATIAYGGVLIPELMRYAPVAASRLVYGIAGVWLGVVGACLAYWGWRRGHLGRLRAETRRSVLASLGTRGSPRPGEAHGVGREAESARLPVRRWS